MAHAEIRLIRKPCKHCAGKKVFELAEVFFRDDGQPDSRVPVSLVSEDLYDLRQISSEINAAFFKEYLEERDFPKQHA